MNITLEGASVSSIEQERLKQKPLSIIWNDKTILWNLILMNVLWIAASFCYFLISYELKYIKGDLFINGIVSALSECLAYTASGLMQLKLGIKKMFVLSFGLGALGMFLLIITDTNS